MPTRNKDGTFVKGIRSHPETEFKKGEHWRIRKPFWDRDWLYTEYVTKQRSAHDIASDFGIGNTAITFWLLKHGIPTRSTSETRKVKKWGSLGTKNPMYGRRGVLHHGWKGGHTPYRQMIYKSEEWQLFAKEIRERDVVCRLCGQTKRLEIHHIEPVRFAPILIMWAPNVILICYWCHKKIGRRERWWRGRLRKLIEA